MTSFASNDVLALRDLIVLISGLGLVVLGIWMWRLISRPVTRQQPRDRRLHTMIVLGMLAFASAPIIFLAFNFSRLQPTSFATEEPTRTVLNAPTRVGGIDMPSGTRLQLEREEQLDSFSSAVFTSPVQAYGVPAMRINRQLRVTQRDGDEVHEPTGAYVTVAGDQTVDGWTCTSGAVEGRRRPTLHFQLARDGSARAFEGCLTAAGNLVDGHALPLGSDIGAAKYPDRPAIRWRVSPGDDKLFTVRGIPVYNATLLVDAKRQVVGVQHAQLACRLTLGPVTYAPGTEIESADGDWRKRFPDAWFFKTSSTRLATQVGGDITPGAWVVQSPDGVLRGTMAARGDARTLGRDKSTRTPGFAAPAQDEPCPFVPAAQS
ncbi:hypothetical protein FXN63_01140 [Pigmentiphaga aceris]|uniref:Uncharacterized protein n=1 Tax=Pigmentiphaga aceris TaxID=1940612 RepID=A0A5C0AR60_9BURK|nr:hypothetical protein [Pigmentiphaga aceris]QEI04592.1 hypothetical protein FXN63_01140 [Pigmentiphaga aceris]